MSNLFSTLLCFMLLVENIFCQNNEDLKNSDETGVCLRGFECVPRRRCRPSALRSVRERSWTCRYTDDWQSDICCPRSRVEPVDRELKTKDLSTTLKPKRLKVSQPEAPDSLRENRDRECGRFPRSNRQNFVGGVTPAQGNWPWMVAIVKKDRKGLMDSWCTGFLIDKQHVISAAHCFDQRNSTLYGARIGHIDLNNGQEYHIVHLVVHPGYVKNYFYDDIALLTLERAVDVPNFSPICLPWSKEFINMTGMGGTAAGWGATRVGGPMSRILQELEYIPILSNYECNRIFTQKLRTFAIQFPKGVTPGFICAGFLEGGKDACGGDSGGPLMFQTADQWYAVGIVSFGYSCATPGFPGGYTRISEYLTWINSNKNDE